MSEIVCNWREPLPASDLNLLQEENYYGITQQQRKKYMHQRIRRGFADCDIWNMDHFLLKLLPAMLRNLADGCTGYPDQLLLDGKEMPQSFESYTDWLRDMADALEHAGILMDISTAPLGCDIQPRYEEGRRLIAKAMRELGDNFGCLWD